MVKPLIQARTALDIKQFIKRPAQVLIMAGVSGIGKTEMANLVAEGVLGLSADQLRVYPYQLRLGSDAETEFGIDNVRSLEHFLSLKIPSQKPYNRLVIIEQAENLSLEAQNALLKTLEEPPLGTLIVLCSAHTKSLLPTVRSRAQTITIHKPSEREILDYFSAQGYDEPAVKKALTISGGLPGLMSAILNDDKHDLLTATDYARQLLSQSTFDRLAGVDQLAKNKELALNLCFILQQMAHVSLESSAKNEERWQRVLKASYQAQDALARRAQPKLVLTDLVLSL